MNKELENVNVILPVGGLGTRALDVTRDEIPKHLIRLNNGYTVLDSILTGLQDEGYRSFVFCTGHHNEILSSYVKSMGWANHKNTRFEISKEDEPLGPDGAVRLAIDRYGIEGEALILPGDVSLPWDSLAKMSLRRRIVSSDVMMAVTSCVTSRTTDVGKFVVNKVSSSLERCYGRTEIVGDIDLESQELLTSAAAMAVDVGRYINMSDEYSNSTGSKVMSMRDGMAQWAIDDRGYSIHAFDIEGEVLDMGTPANIAYGVENIGG